MLPRKTVIISALSFSLLFVFAGCKAPVFDLYNTETHYGNQNNAYYKDVTGFHKQYVGTWIYQNGSTSLTVVFQNRNHLLNTSGLKTFYEDLLIGEYKYVSNGSILVNTLGNINNSYGNDFIQTQNGHHLSNTISLDKSTHPKCDECAVNEQRLEMVLNQPGYDGKGIASNSFVLRRFFENGVEKLKVWFVDQNQFVLEDETGNQILVAPFKLPFGEYILTKQN